MSEVGESAYSTTNRSYPLPKRSYCHSAIFLCSSNVWHTPWKPPLGSGGSKQWWPAWAFLQRAEAHLSLFSKLASTAFALFEHNSHTSPHMSGHWYKSILYLYEKKQKRFRFCNVQKWTLLRRWGGSRTWWPNVFGHISNDVWFRNKASLIGHFIFTKDNGRHIVLNILPIHQKRMNARACIWNSLRPHNSNSDAYQTSN